MRLTIGIEQGCCLPGPPGQRRAVNIDALRGHHLGLAVERQVMIELGDDDMGERGESSPCRVQWPLPAREPGQSSRRSGSYSWAGWCARRATAPGRHQAARRCPRPAGARRRRNRGRCRSRCRLDPELIARQMVGQATHRRGPFGFGRHRAHRGGDIGLGFEFFERQLKLFDLAGQLLRRLPERHPPQPCDLTRSVSISRSRAASARFQLGDLGILIQGGGKLASDMADRIAEKTLPMPEKPRKSATVYPASDGLQVRSGRRQSIPSSSIESWAEVRRHCPPWSSAR